MNLMKSYNIKWKSLMNNVIANQKWKTADYQTYKTD